MKATKENLIKGIGEDIWNRLVYMAVKMVLDGTPVGMAVAVIAHGSSLSAEQAVYLKELTIAAIR